MASLGRSWRPLQALLSPSAPRYASLALTRCWYVASSQNGRRGLVTAKAKAKHTPREKTKDATEKRSDAPTEDTRLPLLSLTALRDLAVLCGRNSSGTRAVLRADLEAAMDEAATAKAKKKAPARRILSIDMGVRNLAYCLLHVGAPVSGDGQRPVPELVAWERLSLIGAGAETEADDSTAPAKPPASAFSPPAMAAVAARLISDRLLPLAPTHVLIERQRFRSGGAAAVLEWTVRVNSLEAMLHGIFAYRQLESADANAGNTVQTVQAVSPQRASRFLLQGGMGAGNEELLLLLKTRKTKEKDVKDAKEAFVAGILRTPGPPPLLTYDESIRGMVDAYLLRWDAKQSRGRAKTKRTEEKAAEPSPAKSTAKSQLALSKIDDLADCVAQGLIWLEWEDNKAILRERGAEHLLATKQLTG